MSAERVASAGKPRRARRPFVPSRTIRVPYGDGLPAAVAAQLEDVKFVAVQRPDGAASFLVCETTEGAKKLFAAARAAGVRADYQNYTLYFRSDAPPTCSPAELGAQVREALAPAQLTEFRAYTKQVEDQYVPRGDGHLSLDRYSDMTALLEKKHVQVGERTLSFYPYRPQPRALAGAPAPGANLEQVVAAMGEAMKAAISVALQSQSEAAATFDSEFA